MVLVVGSIASIGPASVPFQRTVARGFAELATPVALSSNATGAALASTLQSVATTTRTALFAALDRAAGEAAGEASQMAAAGSPPAAGGASESCVAAMADRDRGAADVRDGIEGVLGGSTGTSATADDQPTALRLLTMARTLFGDSDIRWAACRDALLLQAHRARVPVSVWVQGPSWGAGELTDLVEVLVGLSGLRPASDLAIVAVATVPPAVMGPSGPSVLPPSSSLVLAVVLANKGNVDELGVRVSAGATVVGPGPAPGRGVVRTVDIDSGESLAVTLPAISVGPGGTYAVTITASDVAGGPSSSTSLTVSISAPATPASTSVPDHAATTTGRSS